MIDQQLALLYLPMLLVMPPDSCSVCSWASPEQQQLQGSILQCSTGLGLFWPLHGGPVCTYPTKGPCAAATAAAVACCVYCPVCTYLAKQLLFLRLKKGYTLSLEGAILTFEAQVAEESCAQYLTWGSVAPSWDLASICVLHRTWWQWFSQ